MINALAEAVKNIKNAAEKQLNKKSKIRILPTRIFLYIKKTAYIIFNMPPFITLSINT